ncbi:MAG: efflux RND transporter permease subunit [Candidatus Saliniplasma sp.]
MIKKKRIFEWFPNFVVDHPKKVISIFIVFTIIMGFYASGMEMDTEEESFQPESDKQEYLQTIQDRFGRTDEAVQIAFTAHEENVFTVDVLQGMLEMEQALLEDETVNRTLAKSTEMPTGMNTLASNILMANQAFLLEDYVIHRAVETHDSLVIVENQTKMYEKMNESFAMNLYIYNLFSETGNPDGIQGANKTMISMAQIVPEPRLWGLVSQYQSEFMELIHTLSSEDMSHYNVSIYLENWLMEMENTAVAHSPFYETVNGTKIILESEAITFDQKWTARSMVLTFFGISEYLEHLQEPVMDGLDGEAPSLALSPEEKEEKLSDMDDEDIKRTVSNITIYDSSRLNESINEGVNNLEKMDDLADSSLDHLDNLGNNLEQTIENLQLDGQYWHVGVLERYHESVNENRSMALRSNQMFAESKTMLRDSIGLSLLMRQMGGRISSTVSRDYSPSDEIESIRAESSIGIAFLDREIERDERLEVQRRIIDLGDQVSEHSEIRVSAQQVMMEEINESANRSLQKLLPAAFVIVVIILLIVYRSFLETVLSLGSLGIAIVWTFGFGVLLGYEFNPMMIAVPILITGLVIDYGIHMVMRYKEEKEDGYHPKIATKITIATVGGALILTTFTTVVGFLSNTLSNIQVMRQFGVLAAVGITASFLLMTAFLPAVLQLFDERKKKGKNSSRKKSKRNSTEKIDEKKIDVISRTLTASADAADRYPLAVLVIVILITTASIYGVVNIDSTFNIQDFLPEDQPQSQNIKYIQDNFNATTSYAHILTEGEVDSQIYLYALHETRENIRDSDMVGGDGGDVMSSLTVLQRFGTATRGSSEYNATIIQAFSDSDTNNNEIPDRNVTGLYDMLFDFEESRSAMMNVVYRTEDGEYTSGRIRLLEDQRRINEDLSNAALLEQELEDDVKPLRDEGFTAKITSGSMIGHDTTSELTSTQLRSLMATIIVVAISLSIVFYFLHKSIVLGVITTAPVAIITLWIVGTMYLSGVSLNVMTVSITALTVGMGVDYSIHITHRFNEERSNFDLYGAVHETVQNTGVALFGSAMTTVAAFGILSTSDILPLSQFGYITALAITYSFLAAVFILPSALMLWARNSKNVKKE